MTLADELAYTTLSSLTSRIRRRELSPVEVVNAFIERISARNPAVNAFVCEDFERAHDEAVKAEQALVNGAEIGPLQDRKSTRLNSSHALISYAVFCLKKKKKKKKYKDRLKQAKKKTKEETTNNGS